MLTTELGAGPLALARARRAQTARILIETTTLPFAEVAFASGFDSVRQFNDTVLALYAACPTQLRSRSPDATRTAGRIEVRLPVRRPFAGAELLRFLAARAVSGVEQTGRTWYARTLRLPGGPATVRLELARAQTTGFVACELRLCQVRDLAPAVERCRRLLDADCDPVPVDELLSGCRWLAPLVRRRPGLRVPGHVDGAELAVRAVLGQQVSVARARNLAGHLVARYGEPLPADLCRPDGEHAESRGPYGGPGGQLPLTHVFPAPEALADLPREDLPLPRARGRALAAMAAALGRGEIRLDRGMDRGDVRQRLLALPGVGPWTAGYIALRALGDPDVFAPTDSGVRNALRAMDSDPRDAERLSRSWRPWRSYGLMHLWTSLGPADAAGADRTAKES